MPQLNSATPRKQPLFTIAIPTFNRASMLRDCVASALAQTHGEFEVLVSDNASTDSTQEVLKRFEDERLRILRQDTNIGMNRNWNACLGAALGDYVIFLSDDDRLSPCLLQKCVSLMDSRSDLPIIVTLSNPHSISLQRTWHACTSRTYKTGIWSGSEILTEFLADRITVTMCSVVIRTDLLREYGGFPCEYPHTGDFAVWAQMLLLGEVGFVNEPCATFSFHSESETAKLSVEQLINDGSEMVYLIERIVDKHLTDPEKRRLIRAEARGCFARRGLIALSDFQKSGGGTLKLFSLLWKFRNHLNGADLKAFLRFTATILCPHSIADFLRRLRPSVPQDSF